MASVNWKKCTTAAGGAMLRHAQRHDDKNVKYHNADVQTADSGRNNVVTCDGVYLRSDRWDNRDSYAAVYGRLKARVAELDAEHPPKRIRDDRKTMIAFTLTAPDGLAPKDERRFFMQAYGTIVQMCGGRDNVSPGYVHRDEIHAYKDRTGTERMSRAHMHVIGIPYTQEYGVNAKHFETRDRMRQLNMAIDAMCRRRFGVPFLTGEQTKGVPVEALKAQSAVLDAQERLNAARNALKRTESLLEAAEERYALFVPLIESEPSKRKSERSAWKSVDDIPWRD